MLSEDDAARKARARVLRFCAVPPIDDVTHTGATNGARRRARSRRGGAPDDERPRGFEPDRMRRLWSDIDHARDHLGLGPDAAAASTPWSVAGIVDYATDVVSGAVGSVLGLARVLPDPRRVVGDALPCVRRLPIIGAFFA